MGYEDHRIEGMIGFGKQRSDEEVARFNAESEARFAAKIAALAGQEESRRSEVLASGFQPNVQPGYEVVGP